MPFGGRGQADDYRKGFANGMKFGRQMVLNHEYIDAAIAEAIDVTVEKLQEMRTEDGFSWKVYVEEQGLNEDKIAAMHVEVLTNAVNAALEDDAITQDQADQILERLENSGARGPRP